MLVGNRGRGVPRTGLFFVVGFVLLAFFYYHSPSVADIVFRILSVVLLAAVCAGLFVDSPSSRTAVLADEDTGLWGLVGSFSGFGCTPFVGYIRPVFLSPAGS